MTEIIVRINHLNLELNSHLLFETDLLEVNSKSRIGLIGANGSGKSTLARLINGDLNTYKKFVQFKNKNIKVGYLEQMSDETNKNFEYNGRLLSELGIPYSSEQLSGGEISKLRLLEAFEYNYDLLILDEPTSHLDIEGIDFLKQMIHNYENAILLISHDRNVLNECVNEIWAIENQSVRIFPGTYDDYINQKNLEIETLKHQKLVQDNEIKRLEESIIKAKEHAEKILIGKKGADHRSLPSRATKEKGTVQKSIMQSAKNMENRIDNMDEIDIPDDRVLPIFTEANIKYDHNNYPIIFNYFDISVGERILVEKINAQIKNGKIVGIKGKNGSGKTTILNTIYEAKINDSSLISFSKNAKIGFYRQLDYLNFKDNEERLLNYCSKKSSVSKHLLKDMLKDLNFGEADFERPLSTLSGGEAVRVTLFLTIISGANILLLDEPTNYLDIDMIKVLEDYLRSYPGTVILTAHDEQFLNNICDETYEIQDNKLKLV